MNFQHQECLTNRQATVEPPTVDHPSAEVPAILMYSLDEHLSWLEMNQWLDRGT